MTNKRITPQCIQNAIHKAMIDHFLSQFTTRDMEEIGRRVANDLLGKEV